MALVKTIKTGDKITFDFSGTDIKVVDLVLLHGRSATFTITADKKIRFDHIHHYPAENAE